MGSCDLWQEIATPTENHPAYPKGEGSSANAFGRSIGEKRKSYRGSTGGETTSPRSKEGKGEKGW